VHYVSDRKNGPQWRQRWVTEVDFGPILLDVPLWWSQAVCRGQQALFYSERRVDQAQAVAICRTCPVLSECESETRSVEVSGRRFGVRAGYTPEQRKGWKTQAP